MDGDAVKQLALHFRQPAGLADGFLGVPLDWKIVDPKSVIAAGPTAEPLAVYSLGAIRDYVTANRDAVELGKVVAHVVSPQIVALSGPLQERARNRETYVKATALNLTDGFLGRFMAIDEFIIGLLTRFAESDDRAKVLKLLGNVKHEQVKTSQDDGVTQTVSAKVGIVLSADVPVPNPITLVPYRTFREVEQPSSLFVLRVNWKSSGMPDVGLFEAGGGAWRLIAIDKVRDWLREALPDTVAVLA